MRHTVKNLVGFTLGATDGEIGKVKEFYFDDETWTIRYLVVDTGNWLFGRIVLISPESLLTPDWENKIFPVNLTKEQVKNSPDIKTELPVSRQEEIKLYKYYPWTVYWGAGYYGGTIGAPGVGGFGLGMPMAESVERTSETEREDVDDDANDKHLRSTDTVTGYEIKATDGEIGEVEDFLIDDNWKIESILIDTGKWLPGKKVVISPDKIKEIDWDTSSVIIETTMTQVKNTPEYDPNRELTKAFRG